ncbi:lipase secretion chaperone [Alteromonas sp. a30]|uniref:lipase secretion chaperone n=1 Tax=Alteromonas sp. a30 TaxID=2730917 RepID=UPI00228122BA|nr:lipase secretion chaperone [Alteromonas sp. a30]MCY7294658.1 lipase chaperone [Alteromonas sp. a30]
MMKKVGLILAGMIAVVAYWLFQSETNESGSLLSASTTNQKEKPVLANHSTSVNAGDKKSQSLSADVALVDYKISAETLHLFERIISESESKEKDLLLDALNAELVKMNIMQNVIDKIKALFSRYIDYKAALAQVKEQEHERPFSSDDMESKLFAIKQLRLDYFSQMEIDQLFREQQLFDEMALARLRIQQDADLTEAQKQQLLEDNIAQLPEHMKAALQPSLDIRKVQAIKKSAQGLSREQKLARFSAEFGQEAGQRLLAAQDRQQEWGRRVTHIKSEIETINQNEALSAEQKLEKIQALKGRDFSKQELKRLDVFLRNPQLLTSQ